MKNVKCIFTASLVILFLLFNGIVISATEESMVKFTVNGEIKKGNNIEIIVDLSNLKNLYSALVDYTYDNTLINVKEIVLNEEIKKQAVLPLFGELNLDGNRVRSGFTFQGPDSIGLNGEYNFVTIKAEVLKDGELELSADKIKLQLVQKTENDMIDLPFMLSLPEKEVIEVKPTPSPGKSEQGSNNLSTNNSDDTISSGNKESDKNKQNVTVGKDNASSNISEQDKSESSSEQENSDTINNEDTILDKKENGETVIKKKTIIGSVIIVILILISTTFIIHSYKKRK